MYIKSGKYNKARIFLPEGQLDEATDGQIQSFLNNQAFCGKMIAIMPDTHYGKGSCVGFTMPLNDYIIPNIVGVDIGCGVSTYCLGTSFYLDLPQLDKVIRQVIPIGFNVHNTPNLNFDEYRYDYDDLDWVCEDIEEQDKYDYFERSLGTLGGGNHFIEVGLGDSGNYYLTVHTGSRNLGLKVANYYQGLAKELRNRVFCESTELDFLPIGNYGDFDGNKYIETMKLTQDYAHLNRRIIATRILEVCGIEFDEELYIESVHNYIGDDNIIRKGAISAKEGERVIIPFNMEDGLILGIGKGNSLWNNSAPHGAGRILSRNKAKAQLNLEEAKSGMKSAGIFTTSLNKDTLDEAKGAYKDKDLILEMIQDTIEVSEFVKPIYNLKAGGD